MNKRIQWSIATGICVLSAVLLMKLAHLLEQGGHPLLSSLICIETEDPRDLYWNINQIELTGNINPDEHRKWFTLRNNIPNFKSYLYRLDNDGQWQETADGLIGLHLGEGSHLIEVRASNTLGHQLPPVHYTIEVKNHWMVVMPDEAKVVRGKYLFRFEKAASAEVAWLREYTLPVIAACPNAWETFITLRRWVREQIPNKEPVMQSRWDAKRILQAVWRDSSLGFICDAYAATYVSACISVGLNARMLHLAASNGNGHYAAEVWSDDHNKWVFMDPLYNCHFSMHGNPLSALDLHQLWKNNGLKEVTQLGQGGRKLEVAVQSKDYFNLFQDIQLINANDFLTTPLTSAMDLLTLKIRFIRYVDDVNLPYSRGKLAYELLMFYYLPLAISGLIVPVAIPAYLVFLTITYVRKNR